jgi:hypothetical protein
MQDADLPAGARIILFDPSKPHGAPRVLTEGFACAGRPSLSPDARRFLFVGKKRPTEPLSIWEMEIGSRASRQVASCEGGCARAIYGSRIYTIDAGAAVPQIVYSSAGGGSKAALFTIREDGSDPRRIVFNPYGARHPLLVSDGRLVYSSSAGAAPGDGASLFAVHTDGTDVFLFTAASASTAVARMPCETGDGEVVFVESDPGDPLGGGSLVAVPRTRSRSERRAVAISEKGRFHSPSPLAEGRILVAHRPSGGGTYGIYGLDVRGAGRLDPVFDAPDRHDLDPVAVVARSEPAGRSSAVGVRAGQGVLYGLDAYLSEDADAGEDPSRVAIAALRVFGFVEPREAGRGAAGREVLLGSVPVEADGSFFLRVPARMPLRLETTDAGGGLLRAMQGFFWVMPNENRGCIGCHENRDLAPPNRHSRSLRRPPNVLEIPAGELGGSAGDPP